MSLYGSMYANGRGPSKPGLGGAQSLVSCRSLGTAPRSGGVKSTVAAPTRKCAACEPFGGGVPGGWVMGVGM